MFKDNIIIMLKIRKGFFYIKIIPFQFKYLDFRSKKKDKKELTNSFARNWLNKLSIKGIYKIIREELILN